MSSGEFTPRRITDVFNNILPTISSAISTVKRNYGVYPTYILAGMKTATALRSLQEVALNIPDLKGELGWRGASAQFMKMQILESYYIEEDKMYLSTKAPSSALEQSTIVDFVFQPLYIIKEVTDGNTRHFVRTRTKVQILRTDGLALITVENINSLLGQA